MMLRCNVSYQKFIKIMTLFKLIPRILTAADVIMVVEVPEYL